MKVISFKKIGEERVYNLSMRGKNHNYLLEQKIVSANSHAICYSINGYITAYLKCHYPAAFFAAYLRVKTDGTGLTKDDDILIAKAECRRMGVNIVPPDVNRSGYEFDVLDDKTIVMGLRSVKGMGEKAVDEVITNQPFNSFTHFLYKNNARIVNKGKIEALAQAGCFDSLGVTRKGAFEDSKTIKDKLNIYMKKKGIEGVEAEDSLNEFPINITHEEWEKPDLLKHEQEVLGELVSGTITDMYPGFFSKLTPPFTKLRMYPDREELIVEFVVKSMLREFVMKTGRNAGKSMIKYRVEDIYGSEIELTVWPTEYKTAKAKFVDGIPVRAMCQISDFNGQRTLMLQKIEKIYE